MISNLVFLGYFLWKMTKTANFRCHDHKSKNIRNYICSSMLMLIAIHKFHQETLFATFSPHLLGN